LNNVLLLNLLEGKLVDEKISYQEAFKKLEKIAEEIQSDDLDIDKSLDLLEEGVKLANICTKEITSIDWKQISGGKTEI
jgi:exodeoxyribonuclease VII small subunit